jgi:hypothetical protein
VYFYANEILTSNVILEGSDVTFEARDSISMRPGFFVNDDGSKYLAQIDTIPPDTNWRWEYDIKDHLGNIRISFADLNHDGNITVSLGADNEILEEHHYYLTDEVLMDAVGFVRYEAKGALVAEKEFGVGE